MKPFAISESHLTKYQKFQWENKAKEDHKPEKNSPGLTRSTLKGPSQPVRISRVYYCYYPGSFTNHPVRCFLSKWFLLRLLLTHVRSNFMLNGFRNRNQHGICSRLKTKYELLWIPSNIAYAGWTCWCSSESQRFRSTAYCRPNREYSRYLLFAWIREHLIVWILSGVSM